MDFKHYQLLKKNMFQPIEEEIKLRYPDVEAKNLNPLILAYVGDAYFHLYVRTNLLKYEQSHVRLLNDVSMLFVSATWQAKAYATFEAQLTEEEKSIFKRGKNTKSHAPRVASVHDYHISTGIEAVLGYLYLNKELTRLDELCELSFRAMMKMYHAQYN